MTTHLKPACLTATVITMSKFNQIYTNISFYPCVDCRNLCVIFPRSADQNPQQRHNFKWTTNPPLIQRKKGKVQHHITSYYSFNAASTNSQKSSNAWSADNMGMKTMLQNIPMEKGVVGVFQSPALVVWRSPSTAIYLKWSYWKLWLTTGNLKPERLSSTCSFEEQVPISELVNIKQHFTNSITTVINTVLTKHKASTCRHVV